MRPREGSRRAIATEPLHTTALPSLPRVSAERREALRTGPGDPEAHAAALASLPGLAAVECQPAPARGPGRTPGGAAPGSLRVAAWNAERGPAPEAGAGLLARAGAGAALLSELDWGMARSGQRHAARELAVRLGWARAFGVEFLELDRGDAAERAATAGAHDEVGYHGNAVLSSLPLERAALVRLEGRGDWFGPERDQRRVGGRCAVLAEVRLAGGPLVLAAVHLESHSDPADRAAQMGVLLRALDAWAPGAAAVVGGDLNTFSLPLGVVADPARAEELRAALARDPARWGHPVPHEPLFAAAAEAGFDWRACNLRGVATHRVSTPPPSSRGALKLDWLLARGLEAGEPDVVAAVDPATGRALSDHELVAATFRLPDSGIPDGGAGPRPRTTA